MLLQNRPFIRKKLKTRKAITIIPRQKRYLTSRGKKLSIHKVKKCEFSSIREVTIQRLKNMIWKVEDIQLNLFAKVNFLTLRNRWGVLVKMPGILGWDLTSFVAPKNLYEHFYTQPVFEALSLQRPFVLSNIVSSELGPKKLATRSYQIGVVRPDGSLIIRHRIKPLKWSLQKSNFIVGSPAALNTKHYGITSIVRGIAKNPIDHPNGGRANTKGSFKTPWGKYAKANK